ncbi:MAG: hypothetical protein QXH97_03675 [Candidatus Bathyarchaeia archaeon]
MRLKKAIIEKLVKGYQEVAGPYATHFIPTNVLISKTGGNPTVAYRALTRMIRLGLAEELYIVVAMPDKDGVFRFRRRRYIRLNLNLITLLKSAPYYYTIEEKVEWARNIQKFIILPIIKYQTIRDLFIEPLVINSSIFIPPSLVEEIEKERWIHKGVFHLLDEAKGGFLRLKILLNKIGEREKEELMIILYHLLRRWPAFCRACFNQTSPLLRPVPCPEHGEINPLRWSELISLN